MNNGNIRYLNSCDIFSFQDFVKQMDNWKKSVVFNCIWMRKKDIHSFELMS